MVTLFYFAILLPNIHPITPPPIPPTAAPIGPNQPPATTPADMPITTPTPVGSVFPILLPKMSIPPSNFSS